MSKNVAVFVDVANIFYAAKAAGVDIDYVTLLQASTAGRDFVRAYAYTGLDPENENQRQFHSFLARSNYKVVSKDIRKYGDGRIKANLDIELVVDMMRMAQHIDIAVVVSGDGDFAPAIRAVQQMGVRVEVISFRGNTSSDLIEVADVFRDISQLARVEKSDRSGRRVASDDDLSMTEVPEKETDVGPRRRRVDGRRPERGDRSERGDRTARGGRRAPVEAEAVESGGNLIVLPGERLSRAPADDLEAEELIDGTGEIVELGATADEPGEAAESGETAEGRRRRRRRGGRGRGRGRRGEGELAAVDSGVTGPPSISGDAGDPGDETVPMDDELLEEEVAPLPQHSTFGSVWESQIGVSPSPVSTGSIGDDEGYDDEPEIPEYLLAERRQQGRGRGRDQRGRSGNTGGRTGGYRSAVDRERYGRGGVPGGGYGSAPTAGRGGVPGGGYGNAQTAGRGDQRDRGRGHQGRGQAPRQPRPQQQVPRPQQERPAPSAEPWSEVPADMQELLRAELARRQPPTGRPPVGTPSAALVTEPGPGSETPVGTGSRDARPAVETSTSTRSRSRRPAATAEPVEAAAAEPVVEADAPAKAPTRRRTTKATASTATASTATAGTTAAEPVAEADAPAKAPTRRRTTKATTPTATASTGTAGTTAAEPVAEADAPAKAPTRRRTTKATASTAKAETAAAEPVVDADAAPTPKPRRRTTRSAPAEQGEG